MAKKTRAKRRTKPRVKKALHRVRDGVHQETKTSTIINFCKAKYISQVRDGVSQYFSDIKGVKPEEQRIDTFLNTGLSPTGKLPATHYVCELPILEKYREGRFEFLRTFPGKWAAKKQMTLQDDYSRHGFGIIDCTLVEFLSDSGLQVIG